MSNAEEIARLENAAMDDEAHSLSRWRAAKLIWTDLQTMSFRALSDELRAEQAKRYSVGYLQRMNKVWDRIGRQIEETFGVKVEDAGGDNDQPFPDFRESYNSDQIQMSDNPRPMPMPQPGNPRPRDESQWQIRNPRPQDTEPIPRATADDLVTTFDAALRAIEEFPGFWPFLSADAIATLRATPPRLRRIVASVAQSRH